MVRFDSFRPLNDTKYESMNLDNFLLFQGGLLLFTRDNSQYCARIRTIAQIPPRIIIDFAAPFPVGHFMPYNSKVLMFIFDPEIGVALADEDHIFIELSKQTIPRWGNSIKLCRNPARDRSQSAD